ncbi:MAG: Na+/H+ antiporter NhaA [Alphaproteobacteria bacterium]|nr:Na+/H+ antiporter NhaA [Alphaproteobacteria bacterium]MCB9927857.1 Na+/H+ antiporter NhaA [Alphaproteobacteria bacterium]
MPPITKPLTNPLTQTGARLSAAFRDFIHLESSGGMVLALAAVLAIIAANSPWQEAYNAFLTIPGSVEIGSLVEIRKPLLLWVNDLWMAIFFFLVGLEIKREFLEGELSSMRQVALPGIAAIGGMIVPALIYTAVNFGSPANLNGWAIPAATDIAFALAVLSLLGKGVPSSLKILLLAIAIFDDLGAIIIIALFYTADLSPMVMSLAVAPLVVLLLLNLAGVRNIVPYVLVGAVLWVIVLKSGVHATLAGVITAFAIPLTVKRDSGESPLKLLEHELHVWVAFLVLPMFAFANAGVSLAGMGLDSLTEPVTLGIVLGLFVGKQLGIFGTLYLTIRSGLAPMPTGARWIQLYGVAALAGIGFTMSLFIGGLAFEHANFAAPIRMGVLVGSIASAVVGFIILRLTIGRAAGDEPDAGDSDGAPAPSAAAT